MRAYCVHAFVLSTLFRQREEDDACTRTRSGAESILSGVATRNISQAALSSHGDTLA